MMRSSYLATVVLVLTVLIGGCGLAAGMQGSGNMITDSRDVTGFSEINLRGTGNLTIRQTGTESLTIEAEDNLLPRIVSEVQNDQLTIGPEFGVDLRATQPINYTVTVQDLRAITVAGAGQVEAHDIETPELRIVLSGSWDMTAGGTATSQEVTISGSARYDA